MSTPLERLTELIEALPPGSVTVANLLAVRAAIKAGEEEEWRLHAALKDFAEVAISRLRALG